MIKRLITGICLVRLMIFSLFAQDIHSTSAVVLPVSPATTYTVSSGQTVNISSSVSVTFGPGTTLASGSTVSISISNTAPSNPANDFDKNWVLVRSYDENGVEISASKSFFDNNGKALQTQSKNETAGHVLASQTIYDLQGRGAISTLSAPINNSEFAYNSSFVTNSTGAAYDYTNFDWNTTYSSAHPYTKTNSPDAVNNTQVGSLGWYYSNNNTFEPFVATTSYPYARTDFYHDGTGAGNRSADVGDQLKMGAGHEAMQNGFPVINELNNYVSIRNQFFASTTVGATPASLAGQAFQTVSVDQNGLQAMSIADLSGKTLMTGRADPNGWLTVNNSFTTAAVAYSKFYFLVNNYRGDPTFNGINDIKSLTVNSSYPITVFCNGCGTTLIYQGTGNNFSLTSITAGESFEIESDYPFTVTGANSAGVIEYDQSASLTHEPSSATTQYFQLTNASAVTITSGFAGTYKLYDMKLDADITASFTSGNTLPAGYYKVISVLAQDGNGNYTLTSPITVTYTNKYSDISYNYYNQLGQLIANIAPNGVKTLIQNGYGSYTSASQLPFISQYEYDLQGRLTATISPDGGRSETVYRPDGKIRFSQNAYQRNVANSGGSNERYSYTTYDAVGRPIESGEYVAPAGAFAAAKTNNTLIESPLADGGLTGGTKQTQVNTYYDVPATNLAPSGYIQDAGFLKGSVSYTSNANSTTWYNYDDHGRVTWVVKQILGLTGYKSVDYTYNDQGNVTRVDYQKGNSAERFIHYYDYDADGKLVNVKTSRDDVTKVQQAAYFHYLHGPLKRVELGDNLQGLDYVYTPQGWLKSINTPTGDATKDPNKDGVSNSFAKDAFGLQLEYFSGDYSRTTYSNIASITSAGQQDYFNGNVNGISWQSNKPPSVVSTYGASIQNPAMYTYTYDPKYQLAGATWGTPNYTGNTFTGSTSNIFQEKNIAYDANGNITGLQRTNSAGTLSDDFSSGYAYQANTNKLNSVTNATTHVPYATYTYDDIGRMKNEVQTGAPNSYYVKYDVTGKITGIYSDAAMTVLQISYTYDESGNRIKTVNANGTTYYVYDASGNVLAIYSGTTPTISEIPVYGSSRLGTYTVSSGNYVYELQDNVSSVRVVINRTKNGSGQADITTYNDYFPYGSIAQSGGTTYRYDYQGAYAEKDPVTGWNNFDLRMYDGRIGRWLSIDPNGQHSSPYEGMGNNPVTRYDPTGGIDSAWYGMGGTLDGDYHQFVWADDNTVFKEYGGKNPVRLGNGEYTGWTRDGYYEQLHSDGTRDIGRYPPLGLYNHSYDGLLAFHDFMNVVVPIALTLPMGGGGGGGSLFTRVAEGAIEEIPAIENTVVNFGIRAFHSGEGTAERAIEAGFETLGKHRAGENLQNLITSKNIPWKEAKVMWARLSAVWAKGVPDGSTVAVFLNNPAANSVYIKTELPILLVKGVNIVPR